jgi:hypothetical protein
MSRVAGVRPAMPRLRLDCPGLATIHDPGRGQRLGGRCDGPRVTSRHQVHNGGSSAARSADLRVERQPRRPEARHSIPASSGRLAPRPTSHNDLIPRAREGRPKTAAPVLDFSLLRPTKSYAPNNELRSTHRSAQSMAYKFRTNSQSHELWRETA